MRVSLRALPALFGTGRHGPILEHCQVRRHVRFLVGLSLLVVGSGIGLRDPWGVDEERFLGVAREMLQNGSWLVLHRAGEPYPDKPPLFMWLLALASHVTGAPRMAFRLPGLLAGLVGTLSVYDLGRRLWTRGVGLVAGLLFLATIQSLLVLKAGQTDALLILWTTLGLYGLVRHLTDGPAWGWYAVASVAMGLGVLTKGVGFLPLLLFVPYAEGRRRGFRGLAYIGLADRRWLVGPVLLLGTVAVWLGPLLIRVASSDDPTLHAYAWNLLVTQTAVRMVAAEQHREPFWYFLVQVIPVLWLPIVAGLPWLVRAWRRRLARGDGRLALLLGWVVLVVTLFQPEQWQAQRVHLSGRPGPRAGGGTDDRRTRAPPRVDARTPARAPHRNRPLVSRDDHLGIRRALHERARLPASSRDGTRGTPNRTGARTGAHPLAGRPLALRTEPAGALRVPRGRGPDRASTDVAPRAAGPLAPRE